MREEEMKKAKFYPGTKNPDVTEREIRHGEMARIAAREGIVLLKNEASCLPIPEGSRIGLYGAGAVKTIKGGTGSGDVNNRASVSIWEGLKQAGYEISSEEWLAAYEKTYDQARLAWKDRIFRRSKEEFSGNFFNAYSATPFYMPAGATIDEKKAGEDGAELAIFVLARIAGENMDRREIKGDYYLSDEEEALLKQVCNAYRQVVFVLNAGGIIDMTFLDRLPNIMAVLYYVQGGQEGGNALADVLKGNVSPCGKLVDSWPYAYGDLPDAAYFSHRSEDVYKETYKEDIYVGYRYFDTFEVPMRYGFGFGLSYTVFSLETTGFFLREDKKICVAVTVKNQGCAYAGKEVVQIYVSAPQTERNREFRRLVAFQKTKELKAGEEENLQIIFDPDQLTSYDEKEAAWVLDGGSYGVWMGNSLQNASLVGAVWVDKTKKRVKCEHICPLKEELDLLSPEKEKLLAREADWISQVEQEKLPRIKIFTENLQTEMVSYSDGIGEMQGKEKAIVDALDTETIIRLVTGDPAKEQAGCANLGSAGQAVPGAAAETSDVAEAEFGIPSLVLADGPAGLRLRKKYYVRSDGSIDSGSFEDGFENGFFSVAHAHETEGTPYYQYCTAIPVGTMLAQTWNTDLVWRLGSMIGKEMQEFHVDLWLAPGMCIHRNPLCGRNFEYFSEDPYLTGRMAAAMTKGVQSFRNCGTTIKHFACNNQEDNRMGSDSVVTERALREIYLKGFEIAVKEAMPRSIMTSYNLINGVHTANSYDLCTKVARNEWGFDGAIMTDWTTTTDSTAGECTASGCMRVGNDLVMPGTLADHEDIRAALANHTLKPEELKRSVYHILRMISRLR